MTIFSNADWINQPRNYELNPDSVVITTEPNTDFWQRSYYGFRNDNAPALLLDSDDNFTFMTRVDFTYRALFDQCGIIVYLNSENWFKASIEYENSQFSRLGSVVTNMGYSDWATTDVELVSHVWYRLSRRGPDFLLEASFDGIEFKQMRIFHLHLLGITDEAMGKANPPLTSGSSMRFGVYACSPEHSSFTAKFSEINLQPCQWKAHSTD